MEARSSVVQSATLTHFCGSILPNNLDTVGDFPSTPQYGQVGILTGDFTGVIFLPRRH